MPFEPLRFLHAANAFLDEPLRVPESLRPSSAALIEEATLRAFDNLIALCETEEIDFLLLSGNVFAEQTRSLQARVTLQEGLQRLGTAGIPVYILPGEEDPPEAWRRIPALPAHVTLLADGKGENTEPLAVFRGSHVIASLGPVVSPGPSPLSEAIEESVAAVPGGERQAGGNRPTSASAAGERGVFRIGYGRLNREGHLVRPSALPGISEEECGPVVVSPHAAELTSALHSAGVDYLALGGPVGRTLLRTDSGVIHHPGPLQPRGWNEGETGGATLVEVDRRGEIRCTFLPTASVRYRRLKVVPPENISPETLTGWLTEHFLQQAGSVATAPTERLHILEWELRTADAWAAGPLAEEERANLLSRLPSELSAGQAGEASVALVHDVQVVSREEGAGFLQQTMPDSVEETVSHPPAEEHRAAAEPEADGGELFAGFCREVRTLEFPATDLLHEWNLSEAVCGKRLLKSAHAAAQHISPEAWRERIASRGRRRLQEAAEGEAS